MIDKQTHQSGSAALIITIFITAIIAGGVGYTWWQNSNKQEVQATNTQTDSRDTEDENQNPSGQEGYLIIDEWGVKLKTSLVDHLEYQPQTLTNTGSPVPYDELGLKIKSSSVVDQYCVNFGTDLYRQQTPTDNLYTKKIGDYYYYVKGAPGICSEEPSDVQIQRDILKDVDLANLEAI